MQYRTSGTRNGRRTAEENPALIARGLPDTEHVRIRTGHDDNSLH